MKVCSLFQVLLTFLLVGCGEISRGSPSRSIAQSQEVASLAPRWKQQSCQKKGGAFFVVKHGEELARDYQFRQLSEGWELVLPFQFSSQEKWDQCFHDKKNHFVSPSGESIVVKFQSDSPERAPATSCSQMISYLIVSLGLARDLESAHHYFQKMERLPRFILKTCSCSRMDLGPARFGACKKSLSKEVECPESAFQSEQSFGLDSFSSLEHFQARKCDGKAEIILEGTYSFISRKRCIPVERKISFLNYEQFEQVFLKSCFN